MTRILDFLLAALGLLVLLPFFVTFALVVKMHDGGSVFHRALRVGKDGELFRLYKFRTMVPDADKIGAAITTSGDQRITPPGRFLRRYKIDELPQLINVLKGEMSLVGARPEDPEYVALYSDEQRKVLDYRPGMTSPASLEFRNEESLLQGPDWREHYVGEILPRKLSVDLSYLRQRTITSDVHIILRTLGGIL